MRLIKNFVIAAASAAAILLPPPAKAGVRVFACEPEWAALAEAVGGGEIEAFAATTAFQDPHYIRARPSLIARIRSADLVFCSGADLEIGWLPLLLQRGAPAGVQPGQPGHLLAADHVELRDRPLSLDRAAGDIHPQGNPHVHLDPRNLVTLARVLAERLAIIDPANAERYQAGVEAFVSGWLARIAAWEKRAEGFRGMKVITHHKAWTYLVAWLGLDRVATLEPKPGLPPTSAHLEALLDRARTGQVSAILRTPYDP
ncbi:MAG: zinc ABC transporter substrate-binding protein, partial [Alphaproteobacteria bacterium]